MPNPTPTREEKDRALKTAKSWDTDPDFWHESAIELARCHLHATAELARAEERIRRLRGIVEEFHEHGDRDTKFYLDPVLDRDDKLARGDEETPDDSTTAGRVLRADEQCVLQQQAGEETVVADSVHVRGESEETKMQPVPQSEFDTLIAYTPKFTPKPGERVVLVSSPATKDNNTPVRKVGRVYVVLRVLEESVDSYWHLGETGRSGFETYVHRDAVFAPAPAQAERPPAVASGVAAGEVTGPIRAYVGALFDAVRAGSLASGAATEQVLVQLQAKEAEVAELKRETAEARAAILRFIEGDDEGQSLALLIHDAEVETNCEWEQAEAARKEVAELKRAAIVYGETWQREFNEVRRDLEAAVTRIEELATRATTAEGEAEQASQELEAEKVAHQRMREERDHYREKALFADAQKARSVPSREDILRALRRGKVRAGAAQSIENSQVDELWPLFASPPASPDNTPPEPLPEVLPAGTRWFAEDGEVGVLTEPATKSEGHPSYVGRYSCHWMPKSNTPGHVRARYIDWAHWRSQQNQGPTGQKEGENVTVCDSEILRVGAPAAEASGHLETVRGAGAAACPGTAGERGNRGEPPQAAGGERLRGPSGAVDSDSGSPGCADPSVTTQSEDAARARQEVPQAAQPGDASLSADRARLEAEEIQREAKEQGIRMKQRLTEMCNQTKLLAPSPDAGIEAVKAEVAELKKTAADAFAVERGFAIATERARKIEVRLAELEFQGRVVKRLCTDNRAVLNAETWARIEREEREAAGKAQEAGIAGGRL
jgi:hypothetical protein